MKKLIIIGLCILLLLPFVQGYLERDIDTIGLVHNFTLVSNSSTAQRTGASSPGSILHSYMCFSAGVPDRNSQWWIDCTAPVNLVNLTNGTPSASVHKRLFTHDRIFENSGTPSPGEFNKLIFRNDNFTVAFEFPNNETSGLAIDWSVFIEGSGATSGYFTPFMYNFTSGRWVACNAQIDATTLPQEVSCGYSVNITDSWNFFNSSNYSLFLIDPTTAVGGGGATWGMDWAYANVTNFKVNNRRFQGSDGIEQCIGATVNQTVILGFDFKEEINQTSLDTVDGEAFFQFWHPGNFTPTNLSISSFTDKSQLTICASPWNQTWLVNGTIEYEDVNYLLNDYYLTNASLNSPINTTNNITLFLLHENDGTLTTLSVSDELDDPVANQIIFIQRYDVGTGTFRTIAMAKTDSIGEDTVYLEHNTGWYRFLINNQYLSRKLTSAIQRVTGDLAFQIGPLSFETTLDELYGVQYNLTYDDALGRISVIFLDPTGKQQRGCLRVMHTPRYTQNYTTKSNQCVESSSGSIGFTTANLTGIYRGVFEIRFPGSSPAPFLSPFLMIDIGRTIVDDMNLGADGTIFHYIGALGFVGIGLAIHPIVAMMLYGLWLFASVSIGLINISGGVLGGVFIAILLLIYWSFKSQ